MKPVAPAAWVVFYAAAAGRRHLEDNEACQDFGCHRVVGGVLVGVVCDGAGSAAEGRLGAEHFAAGVVERLAEAVRHGDFVPHEPAGQREGLATAVQKTREDVGALAQARERGLADFACTLVGCAVGPQGGCFFHVGDGFAVHRDAGGASVLSLPENGEYADETYFVTDENWLEHLRVTTIPAPAPGGVLALMSDGTAPFAVNRERTALFPPFIDPVVNFLREAGAEIGNRALHGVLASERTLDITSDDKALLLALAL